MGTSSDDPVDAAEDEDVIDDRDVEESRVIEDARDVTDVDAGVKDVVDKDEDVVEEDEVVEDEDEDEEEEGVVDELLFNVFRPSLFILNPNNDFKCMPTTAHMSTHLKKGSGFFLYRRKLFVPSLLKIPMPLLWH